MEGRSLGALGRLIASYPFAQELEVSLLTGGGAGQANAPGAAESSGPAQQAAAVVGGREYSVGGWGAYEANRRAERWAARPVPRGGRPGKRPPGTSPYWIPEGDGRTRAGA